MYCKIELECIIYSDNCDIDDTERMPFKNYIYLPLRNIDYITTAHNKIDKTNFISCYTKSGNKIDLDNIDDKLMHELTIALIGVNICESH